MNDKIISQIPFKLIIKMQLFVQRMPFKLGYFLPQNTGWDKTDLNLEIKIERVIIFSYILLTRIFKLIKEESLSKLAKISSSDVWKKNAISFYSGNLFSTWLIQLHWEFHCGKSTFHISESVYKVSDFRHPKYGEHDYEELLRPANSEGSH